MLVDDLFVCVAIYVLFNFFWVGLTVSRLSNGDGNKHWGMVTGLSS